MSNRRGWIIAAAAALALIALLALWTMRPGRQGQPGQPGRPAPIGNPAASAIFLPGAATLNRL